MLKNFQGFRIQGVGSVYFSFGYCHLGGINPEIPVIYSFCSRNAYFQIQLFSLLDVSERKLKAMKRAYPNEKITDNIEHNGITLNILTNTIQYNDKSVELTKNEFKILHYLLINRGKIVSRVDILDYLWDSALFVNDNTLTVNITRIRNKMEELGIKDYIKTKRGQGYMI